MPRLLTALIPVEPQPDTVLAPVVLAWLAGFAGAELAERSRRTAVALIPPTLLYAGALVLVGPNAGFAVWQPLAFATLAARSRLVASGRRLRRCQCRLRRCQCRLRRSRAARYRPGERAGLRLRAAGGLAIGLSTVLAVVALAAPLVASSVGRQPLDPRRYVQPPTLDVLDQNPLIRVAGWAANPDQRLFDVSVLRGAERPRPSASPSTTPTPTPSPGAPELVAAPTDDPDDAVIEATPAESDSLGAYDTRLRLAVLEEWDGVTWHMGAEYRNAGRVLPPTADPPGLSPPIEEVAPALRIEERITVDQLRGRLMPAICAPQRVDGVRVAFDPATGTLLRAEQLVPGTSYTIASESHSLDLNLLPAADVPSGPEVARLLAVGDAVPADLTTLAQKIVAGETSPYLKALAIESFLSEHYRFAADAPTGHAYPNLRFFLFDDPRAGGQRGTSEQFAAAFATLGRLMGLPTRVVVGFRTPAGGGTVKGSDGLAWPEVLFGGVGWVAFDPLPDPNAPPRQLEDEYLPKATPPTTPPNTVQPSTPATTPAATAAPQSSGAPVDGVAVGTVAGGLGGGLLTLVMPVLAVIVVLRWLRQRERLRRGSPPERILGAWDEILDALELAGSPPARHLAAGEVAAHAARVIRSGGARHIRRPRPAAPELQDLAAKVNAVGFAGATVGAGGTDDIGAHTATIQAAQFARALRARRSWWRRLLWRVDPRPLRRRR